MPKRKKIFFSLCVSFHSLSNKKHYEERMAKRDKNLWAKCGKEKKIIIQTCIRSFQYFYIHKIIFYILKEKSIKTDNDS